MNRVDEALEDFRDRVTALGWVTDVLVGGSLATGDHHPGVSDLDLVALVDGPMDDERVAAVRSLHTTLDGGTAQGLALGCLYVDASGLDVVDTRHPTWTHGVLVQRPLSLLARVELAQRGWALTGRGLPGQVASALLATTDGATGADGPGWADGAGRAAVRAAVQAELDGYWTWAVRRPWLWLEADLAHLGLITMARARHALAHGELVAKGAVLDEVAGPRWLARQVRARRTGGATGSPRLSLPAVAAIAWRDAVRTVRGARARGAGIE